MKFSQPACLQKIGFRFDDFLRTSHLPAQRAFWRFLTSLPLNDSSGRLQAAADYLMHRPVGAWSPLALRRARAAAQILQRQMRQSDSCTIIRSAVIKPRVSASEPGVILISFESELRKILALKHFAEIQRDYRLCFMPSWQNFFSPEVFLLDAAAAAPYYLLPSCFAEASLQPLLGPHCRILPFHAASWVNHRLYCRTESPKDIDIIMLANFQRFKRHWKLFEALADLPADLRVRLLGVPLHQRTRASILNEARVFGVAERLEILENADQATIRDSLQRARLMCALSHREGSYVGVAEALLANTPVAMFANAMIGTKSYINEKTGFLLDPGKPLASQLADILSLTDAVAPRDWAIANISAQHNCNYLNELLQKSYDQEGLAWTDDVRQVYCIRFDFFFEKDISGASGDLSEDYARLKQDYGLIIARPEFPA